MSYNCFERPWSEDSSLSEDRLEERNDTSHAECRQRRLVIQQLHGIHLEFRLLLSNPLHNEIKYMKVPGARFTNILTYISVLS